MSGGDAEPLLRYGATSNRYRGAAGAASERASTLKAGARVAGYRRSFSLLWTLFCWLLIITLGVAALLIAAGLVGLSASPWTMPGTCFCFFARSLCPARVHPKPKKNK